MRLIHSPSHALHDGGMEMHRGELAPCFEMPARVDYILAALARAGWPVEPPYEVALGQALERVAGFAPQALVVSLGVDIFEDDPISGFRLATGDFPALGARIAGLGLPTVLVQEGGYAVSAIGDNVAGVLAGFA